MLIRISGASEGLAEYLRNGVKKGEPLKRLERDIPIPLLGSLDAFEACEKYAKDRVDYAGGNFRHITFSFSSRDMEKKSTMSEEERIAFYQQIIQDFINFYMPGYEPEEYVAYGEAHRPLTKTEAKRKYFIEEEQKNWEVRHPGKHMAISKTKDKYEHIHLGVMMYSPTLDKQIRFRQSSIFVDEMFQRYINEKYGLDNPQNFLQIKKERLDHKDLSELFKDVTNEDEILMICKRYGFEPRLVETKRNRYYSIEYKKQTFNLRGQHFEACEAVTNPKFGNKRSKIMSFEELEAWVKEQTEIKRKDNIKRKGSKMNEEQTQAPVTNELSYESQIETLPDVKPTDQPMVIPDDKPQDRSEVKELVKKPESHSLIDLLNSLDLEKLLDYVKSKGWLSTRYKYEIDKTTNKFFAIDLKGKNQRQSKVSINDFLAKPLHCNLSLEIRQQVANDLAKDMSNQLDKPLPTDIYLSHQVAPLYPAVNGGNPDVSGGHEQVVCDTYKELADIIKKEVYSSAIYYPRTEDEINDVIDQKVKQGQVVPKYLTNPKTREIMTTYGYRDSNHVKKFANVLIYDIDNSLTDQLDNKKTYSLTEAYTALQTSGYYGIVATTKSHQIPKVESILPKRKDEALAYFGDKLLTKSELLTQNPNINQNLSDEPNRLFAINQVDKMRFVVFGKEPFTISKKFTEAKKQKAYERACYDELRTRVAKKFGIENFVDKATKDTARIYNPSTKNAIIKPFEGKILLDFKEMLKMIEPKIEQQMKDKEIKKVEDQQKAYETTLKTPTLTLSGKQYVREIDFDKLCREVHVSDVLKAYDVAYKLDTKKGPQVYVTSDQVLSVVPGVDRDMITDFKSSSTESFDIRELILQFTPYQNNLLEAFKHFGVKFSGKANEFIQKNITAAKNYINEALAKTKITKEEFEEGFSSLFGGHYKTNLSQSSINYGKSQGKVVVQFKFDKDLNLDPQTSDDLKELSKNGVLDRGYLNTQSLVQPTIQPVVQPTIQPTTQTEVEEEPEQEVEPEVNEISSPEPTQNPFLVDLEEEIERAREEQERDHEIKGIDF